MLITMATVNKKYRTRFPTFIALGCTHSSNIACNIFQNKDYSWKTLLHITLHQSYALGYYYYYKPESYPIWKSKMLQAYGLQQGKQPGKEREKSKVKFSINYI